MLQKAAWTVQWHGGALVVKMTGLLTLETAHQARGVIRASLIEREAVKAVLDIRGTVFLMSEDERRLFARQIIEARPFSAPLAILCDPPLWEGVFAHCMEIMQSGRTRFAFSLPAKAAEWAGVPLSALVAPAVDLRQAA